MLLPDPPQVVLPVGGRGTRLKPYTDASPKCLVPVHGKPFLEYVIENLVRQGVRDIVLCTGYRADDVWDAIGDGARWGIRIQHSREPEPLGAIGAVRHALGLLDEAFLLSYGDAYLTLPLLTLTARCARTDRPAVMSVFRQELGRAGNNRGNTAIYGGLVTGYRKNSGLAEYRWLDYGILALERQLLAGSAARDEDDFYAALAGSGRLAALECGADHRPYEVGTHAGYRDFAAFARTGHAAAPEGST